jgi:hypothetical protein
MPAKIATKGGCGLRLWIILPDENLTDDRAYIVGFLKRRLIPLSPPAPDVVFRLDRPAMFA